MFVLMVGFCIVCFLNGFGEGKLKSLLLKRLKFVEDEVNFEVVNMRSNFEVKSLKKFIEEKYIIN